MISLVLVDDHTLVRTGIRGLLDLTPDIRVVGEAADGIEALSVVAAHRPDALLLDVQLPRLSGIGVLAELRARDLLPPTILLTTFDDDQALQDGIGAGARGFLLKDISLDRLADAVRRVAAGESLFQPALTERAFALGLPPVPERYDGPTGERLTRRETEILRFLAAGWSNKEIARAVDTSEGTIKNHVSSVLAKLGVRDRTRAVLKAVQRGLI